jgi:hypothetical protein
LNLNVLFPGLTNSGRVFSDKGYGLDGTSLFSGFMGWVGSGTVYDGSGLTQVFSKKKLPAPVLDPV